MVVDSAFLSRIIEKHCYIDGVEVFITDMKSRILASNVEESTLPNILEISRYILNLQKPSLIANDQDDSRRGSIYGLPLFHETSIWGTILIAGEEITVKQVGQTLKASIEAVLAFTLYSENYLDKTDEKSKLALHILTQNTDYNTILSEMNHLEIDPNRLRTVITIKLHHHQNKYFNNNLNLGYQSAIDSNMEKAIGVIKQNKFINSQDICLLFDNQTIVILKSFLPHKDLSKIYLSLDNICKTISQELTLFKGAFDYKIAYGNLYENIINMKLSFTESLDMITIGELSDSESDLYLLNHFIFEILSHNLHPQMKSKVILPILQKLSNNNKFMYSSVIDSCEKFIDCRLNFAETTTQTQLHRNTIRGRLKKLKALTSLDPINSFTDAFLIKLTAVYLKQNGISDGSIIS